MLRLCIDLNIWVAALLADCKGRSNTASQYLVELVRSSASPVGEVSLIISWWNGLEAVKFQLLPDSIDCII